VVCEVAGIGGEGEEAGGERVRLRGIEGLSGIRDGMRVCVAFEAKQIPRFIRDDGAVFRRVVASSRLNPVALASIVAGLKPCPDEKQKTRPSLVAIGEIAEGCGGTSKDWTHPRDQVAERCLRTGGSQRAWKRRLE
jgi:hypothetical protein